MAEDPQEHMFKVNFQFWVLSCIAIGKTVFFQKAAIILHRVTSWHFFEIHNSNKKWLEISVFENSIIRWVFKVVKEALKKSEKNSYSILLSDSKHSWSASQIEEGEIQALVNNWRNLRRYICFSWFYLKMLHLASLFSSFHSTSLHSLALPPSCSCSRLPPLLYRICLFGLRLLTDSAH